MANKLDFHKAPIKEYIADYLHNIDKEHELDRLLSSMWTKCLGSKIISLDLSRLGIQNIDRDFFDHPDFDQLQYLYLQGNEISELSVEFFTYLTSLKGLNLPNNQIDKIQMDRLSSLNNLDWLNLSSNSIKVVEPNAFTGLFKLRSLNLSHNIISILKKEMFTDLDKLSKLNLFNNSIQKISGYEIQYLNNLTELNLQSNKIIHISDDLPAFLPNLEKLYLKHNPGLSGKNTFESRYEILEMFRSESIQQQSDLAMTELLDFEDDYFITTFNQLIDDPRWDGGIGRVSNYKLSKTIGIPIEVVAKKIETLITKKKFRNIVHFDNNDPTSFDKHYWIRRNKDNGSINTGLNDPKCLWCNVKLIDPFEPCHNCGLKCEICKFSIKQSQEFDVCTSEADNACRDIFHRSEYLEWVKIYESCPKCSQEINLNLYQISQDYSQKVGALVEQDMELPEGSTSNDFLIPMALSILINLKKVRQNVLSSEEMIKEFGKEARDHHQEILQELQPLATEIVMIKAFLARLESNSLTEASFKASIDTIAQRFDIFEENIDLIYKAHEKDESKMDKIKDLIKKGSFKGGEVGVKSLVQRTGLFDKIKSYVKLPTKEGLKSILGRIGQGIRDKTGDPTSWIKIGSVFLI